MANPLQLDTQGAAVLRSIHVLQIGASASSGSDRGVFVEDGSGFWWNYGVTEALVQADRQVTIATPSVSFTLMILV